MGRWCWRLRGRGRPPKERWIRAGLGSFVFAPIDDSGAPIQSPPIYLRPDEFEALRLVYLEGRTQEEAARLMNCLLYTSPSPRDLSTSRMPSSA